MGPSLPEIARAHADVFMILRLKMRILEIPQFYVPGTCKYNRAVIY